MALAAAGRRREIVRDTLRFIVAILAAPDGTATLDDAADLASAFADGGRWRGSIPTALARRGLIECAGHRQSDRAARHRGLVTVWRAIDRAGLAWLAGEIRAELGLPAPANPAAAQGELFGRFAPQPRYRRD
jgi:hypothetical protein